jgi:hypothetical protein
VPTVVIGNTHVIEAQKIDPDGDAAPTNLRIVSRRDLGNQETAMSLPATHVTEVRVAKRDLNDSAWNLPGHVHVERSKGKVAPLSALELGDLKADDEVVLRQTMWPLQEQLAAVQTFIGMNCGGAPAWVESDDPVLAAAVASQYGCPEGRPKDWKRG